MSDSLTRTGIMSMIDVILSIGLGVFCVVAAVQLYDTMND